MADVDLGNPWVLGTILIAGFVLVSVGAEALLLNGDIREGLFRGIFGGAGFTVAYLFLRSRDGENAS